MPPPLRPDVRRPAEAALSRRAALGGVAGVAAVSALSVTGCTVRGADRRPETRTPATRAPGVDPDVVLAATVLAEERAMLQRLQSTLRRHPRLEGVLRAALGVHRAHVDLLAAAVPDGVPGPSPTPARPAAHVPDRPGPALVGLAAGEDTLSLVDERSALAAQSGAFARVLASMAAAAAQQAVVLARAARRSR